MVVEWRFWSKAESVAIISVPKTLDRSSLEHSLALPCLALHSWPALLNANIRILLILICFRIHFNKNSDRHLRWQTENYFTTKHISSASSLSNISTAVRSAQAFSFFIGRWSKWWMFASKPILYVTKICEHFPSNFIPIVLVSHLMSPSSAIHCLVLEVSVSGSQPWRWRPVKLSWPNFPILSELL